MTAHRWHDGAGIRPAESRAPEIDGSARVMINTRCRALRSSMFDYPRRSIHIGTTSARREVRGRPGRHRAAPLPSHRGPALKRRHRSPPDRPTSQRAPAVRESLLRAAGQPSHRAPAAPTSGSRHAETCPPSASAAPTPSDDQTLVGLLVAPMLVRLSRRGLREHSCRPYPRPSQAAASPAWTRRVDYRTDHVELSDASLHAAADPAQRRRGNGGRWQSPSALMPRPSGTVTNGFSHH